VLEPRTLLSNWYVNSANSGTANGLAPASGFKTIQAAISRAGGGDTILVETGNGYDEADTVTANLTKLTIKADTSQAPILNGGAGQSGFTVAATGVTISGFTIENFATGVVVDGGASLTLSGDTIKDNFNPHGDGGGVRNAGTLTIQGGAISGNSASSGGGICNSGGQVQISGAILSGNSAARDGGAILVLGGSLTINDGTLSGNFGDGGGVAVLGGGMVTITGGTVSNNTATGGGGGILVGSGTLTITSATVSGNSAFLGGGIFNSGGHVAVTACDIANNTALSHGGGILNYAGPLKVTNSTIADNSAPTGGGIYSFTAGSMLTTINATIVYNTAGGSGEGGGLDVAAGTATLYNTIVALNADGKGSGATADDIAGTVSTASSYNLIGVGGSGSLTVANSTGNLLNVSRTNAGLAGALGDNGGPTKTVALLETSVAIDAGSATIPGVNVPTTDQRGVARLGGIDIGAYQAATFARNASYVDSAWAGYPTGATVFFPGDLVDAHHIGTDAFATIPDGLNAVSSGGIVFVAAGTYTAEPIVINKSLTLMGSGATTTVIQAPSSPITGDGISIAGGASVSITGVTVNGASGLTGIDVNGATLSASAITVTGCSTAISVTNQGSASITTSTITGNGTGVVVGSSSSDTSTLSANYDNLSSDTVGVDNLQSSGSESAQFDWWGSITGPTNAGNPGGIGSHVTGSVNFSPWLGDANILAPDLFVINATAGSQYVLTPSSGNTGLGVTLGGNLVGTIPGGVTLDFTGSGGTVTINGESGSPDVFTIQDTSVQFNASDGLSHTTINFINGAATTRNVDALGTTNTFNIDGAGASGPTGSLVGGSGTNAFVFSATGKVHGNIQGGGSGTLNYSAYSSGVSVNLENGNNGTATGVTGTVSGITAVIGGNFNDTLNAGSVANVALTGGLGTNALSGTGAGDSVVESISSSYTLTKAQLTGASPPFTDNLTGITIAKLTGSSGTSNTFTVSGWTGTGSLSILAGTATVTASKSADYTLTNTSLSSTDGMSLILNGITSANLTDTGGGHTFTVGGWTGSGSLTDTSFFLGDTVAASKSAGYTLTNTSLSATDGMALGLSGIKTATLSDTAGGHTFTIGNWTGSGSLTDSSPTSDTVAASANAGFTLTNTLLTSTNGMSLALFGITTANLADTGGGHTFTIGNWTGSGSLADGSATSDTVAASANAGFTLTNTLLTSGTMSLTLGSGIRTANLTDTSAGGNTFTITGWTGSGTLKGASSETLVDSVSTSVTLANLSLAVTGLPTLTLGGFTIANLTDTVGGHTFTVGGWTGSGSLTDSSATGDTVAASENAGFTLTNTLLTSGTMSLILSGITIANLTDTGSGHIFTVGGWTHSGSLTDSAFFGGDTVAASKKAGYTLTNTSLSATDGMSLGLSGIKTATLSDTAGGHTFTIGNWTGSGSLTDSSTTGDTVAASANAGFTLTNTLLTSGTMSLILSGITIANLTDTGSGHIFTVGGWNGSGSLTDSSPTGDTVAASKNAGYTLTNTSLSSTDGMSLALSNIKTANLTDTSLAGGNTFTITGWMGAGTLKGTKSETLVDSVSTSVTLANLSLAVTGLPTLTLSGFTIANLTDTVGGHTFTVGGWTGSGSLTDSSATGDTVAASANAGFTLTNTLLTSGTMSLILSGITIANLTDTVGGHTFTIGNWTGSGSLTDSAFFVGDTVVASKSAGYTLTNTSLSATDGMSLGLSGITTANLTDTGSGNTFTVSGWKHGGTLTGTSDTVAASKAANYTLTNTLLSSTDGMSLALFGITTANLTATGSAHSFTVTGWTGSGSLTGTAATVTASKSANYTLTNTALSSTDGMSLALFGITTANLTVTATSGHPNYVLDASAFSDGPTVLTASGTVDAIIYGGTAGNSTLTATGSGNNILIGNGAGDKLTDNSAGPGILIGSGAGGDSLTANANGNDILVSGTTTYNSNTSANIAALDAILAEWTSADSYGLKINKITGVTPGVAYQFNASTVNPDLSANTVKDGSGFVQSNWFIVGPSDHVTKKTNETQTTI